MTGRASQPQMRCSRPPVEGPLDRNSGVFGGRTGTGIMCALRDIAVGREHNGGSLLRFTAPRYA